MPVAEIEQPNRAGRPSPYQGREVAIVIAIADRLRTGEPMAVILRTKGMPSHDAVEDWRIAYPEIERIIARARKEGFDAIAAECLEIADDVSRDTIKTETGEKPDAEWIARSKLRVETRLKLLAKWDRERYGDAPAVVIGIGAEVGEFWKKLRGGEVVNIEAAPVPAQIENRE